MKGEQTAPDQWRMTWDTDTKPGTITIYDEQGIEQLITSGPGVDDGMVHRRLVIFKRKHSGQMRMVL